MFKDLKQILRKEQCDASILLTANVPSAKKIIVHGPQGIFFLFFSLTNTEKLILQILTLAVSRLNSPFKKTHNFVKF